MDWMENEMVQMLLRGVGSASGKDLWDTVKRYVGGKWEKVSGKTASEAQGARKGESSVGPPRTSIGVRQPESPREGEVWIDTPVPGARILVLIERYVVEEGADEVTRHWEMMVSAEDRI